MFTLPPPLSMLEADKPQRGRAGKVKNPAFWEKLQAIGLGARDVMQPLGQLVNETADDF